MLNLVGFDDIGGDISQIEYRALKSTNFLSNSYFFSWCVDKPTQPVIENR